MQYFFKQHEYPGIPDSAVVFLKYINSPSFRPKLDLFNETQWKKIQIEGIEKCVYAFEVLGEKDISMKKQIDQLVYLSAAVLTKVDKLYGLSPPSVAEALAGQGGN